MDNITHSLAGMLAAEAVLVWRRESRAELRTAAYLASALANNLPDVDFVYSWITTPKPLGYLLHHRGHTHTLLLALPMAWLLALGLWRWFGPRIPNASRGDRRLLLGLSLGGPLLHLSLDFGNNYGVHPFWPLSGKWFYGDTIFIVEPLWWALAIPILALLTRRKWLQILLWALLGAVLLACWFVPFVLPASRYVLLALSLLSFSVGVLSAERARISFAIGGWVVIAVIFAVGSRSAKAELRSAAEAAFPALQAHDIAATPMPANPACWEGLLAGEQGGTYLVLRASVALWPLQAMECRAGLDVSPTAQVRMLDRPVRGGVRWISEYRAELAALRQLTRDDCRFRAFLKFARLPYVALLEGGGRFQRAGLYAGDLRYDREPTQDFSDLELPLDPHSGECPRLIPGWSEPRADLLQP